MRLFTSIRLQPELHDELKKTQLFLRGKGLDGRYTDEKNFHLTLAFIGEYPSPQKVMKALREVPFAPFPLILQNRLGRFGHLLWVGVENSPPLQKLQSSLCAALTTHEIPFDNKAFHPHITIVREARPGGEAERICREWKAEPVSMTVQSLSLMQSQRVGGKMVYIEVGRVMASRNDTKS